MQNLTERSLGVAPVTTGSPSPVIGSRKHRGLTGQLSSRLLIKKRAEINRSRRSRQSDHRTRTNAKDVAQQVQESRKEAATEKADHTRDKISQSVEDAKDKVKEKIEGFKERHSA